MADSSLSDEERADIHRQLEARRDEVDAMRPLDAEERDLLRAALPPRRHSERPDEKAS